MTKEEIYDEEINPLMAQILAICKEHKIAMLASFSIPNEDEPELMCSSALLEPEFEPRDCQLAANREIHRRPTFLAVTTISGKS